MYYVWLLQLLGLLFFIIFFIIIVSVIIEIPKWASYGTFFQTPVQRGAMQWDDSENAGFSSSSSPSIPVHPQYAENTWAVSFPKNN